MKIERKEKIKKFFGWKLLGILYAVSFILSCVRAMYYGTFNFILAVFFYSLLYFSFALVISGVIGMVTMIVLKAGKRKILFSVFTIVAGVLIFAIWYGQFFLWWIPFWLIQNLFG